MKKQLLALPFLLLSVSSFSWAFPGFADYTYEIYPNKTKLKLAFPLQATCENEQLGSLQQAAVSLDLLAKDAYDKSTKLSDLALYIHKLNDIDAPLEMRINGEKFYIKTIEGYTFFLGRIDYQELQARCLNNDSRYVKSGMVTAYSTIKLDPNIQITLKRKMKECSRFYSTTLASNRRIEYKIAITDGHATLNYAKDPHGTKDTSPFTDTYVFEEFSACKSWRSTWSQISPGDY